MFKCPCCQNSFKTQRELLRHFCENEKCRGKAIEEVLVQGLGLEAVVMVMDTSFGKVNPQEEKGCHVI